jgi:hypothetical protein
MASGFPEGVYGCGICSNSDSELFHTGYARGYKTTLSYLPKQEISLAILENVSIDNNCKTDFKTHKNIRNELFGRI